MNKSTYIWFNGRLVEWEKATVHVMVHALHYGSSVFEGIRAYDTPKGTAIFRLNAHLERFSDSARIYRILLGYSNAQLASACHELLRANNLKEAYIRPIAYRGFGEISPNPKETPIEVAIAAIPFNSYVSDTVLKAGVDVCVSSWRKPSSATLPMMAKAGGHYLFSQLVVMEAEHNGYIEGITLDSLGQLSEGSGENLFVVRHGVLMVPPLSASILPGITRDTVISLAQALQIEVQEQAIPREALYVADELFFTGTAVEILPIRSVDGIIVKANGRGSVTEQIQKAFIGLFSGEMPDVHKWLEYN